MQLCINITIMPKSLEPSRQ